MTKPRKLRVYYLSNGDGQHEFLIAAPTQKDACQLMGTGVRGFRDYGGRRCEGERYADLIEVALREPGRLFRRRIDTGSSSDRTWVPCVRKGTWA